MYIHNFGVNHYKDYSKQRRPSVLSSVMPKTNHRMSIMIIQLRSILPTNSVSSHSN